MLALITETERISLSARLGHPAVPSGARPRPPPLDPCAGAGKEVGHRCEPIDAGEVEGYTDGDRDGQRGQYALEYGQQLPHKREGRARSEIVWAHWRRRGVRASERHREGGAEAGEDSDGARHRRRGATHRGASDEHRIEDEVA